MNGCVTSVMSFSFRENFIKCSELVLKLAENVAVKCPSTCAVSRCPNSLSEAQISN